MISETLRENPVFSGALLLCYSVANDSYNGSVVPQTQSLGCQGDDFPILCASQKWLKWSNLLNIRLTIMFIVYRAENSFYSINISPYNFENKSINWQHDNVQMFVTLNSQHYEMINFLEALVAKSLSSNFICSLRYNIIYSFLLSPLPHYLNDVPGITHLFKKLCCYFPLTARRPRGRYIDVRDV